MSKKVIILLLVVPLIIGVFSISGYYLYIKLGEQTKINEKQLEKFGFEMVPPDFYQETKGVLGSKQLPSTFAEDDLPPAEKVIRGLINDKQVLEGEKEALRADIELLKERIRELEEYRKLNEHFAPDSFDEEIANVEIALKKNLLRATGSKRFSTMQLEIMAAASAVEYRKFVYLNRMILTDIQRDQLVQAYLPSYSYCIGDGIGIATNSRREEVMLAEYFRNGDANELPNALREDLEIIMKPCQEELYKQLKEFGVDKYRPS